MLEKEFGEGLALLKAFYPNWSIDITNGMILGVWYESFKELQFKVFQEVVKKYCMSNRFPPNSPFDLLDMIPKEMSAEEAWELILDTINRSKDNSMFLNMMYKNQTLYPFVKHFNIDEIETDSYGNKCYGYNLGKRFKREYKAYLDSKSIKSINGEIIYTDIKMLESA